MADSITKAEIIKPENLVYKKTSLLTDKALSYCPGCGHGTAHRIIMEVLDEMGLQSKTIGVAPVGCSVLAYEFMNIDMQQAAHGRAPALATAIKRLHPEKTVFHLPGRRRPCSHRYCRNHSCLQPGRKFHHLFYQ